MPVKQGNNRLIFAQEQRKNSGIELDKQVNNKIGDVSVSNKIQTYIHHINRWITG
jgi:hypothetical protein